MTRQKRMGNKYKVICICLFIPLLLILITPSVSKASDKQELVDKALVTFNHFIADPNMGWVRSNLKYARGVFIVPQKLKGAFIFGASGGSGVLLVKDDKTGHWTYPAFYTMGSASFGLQIGAKVSEVILLIMTQKGIDALLSTSFKLGADISVAAGPVGAGAGAKTVDVLAFARSKGLFGGVDVKGAVIVSRDKWNQIYYGKPARPVDVIIRHNVSNKGAIPLIRQVSEVAGSKTGKTK